MQRRAEVQPLRSRAARATARCGGREQRRLGHGERSRLQLLFKLGGTDTEGFPFWLFNLVVPVCLRVFLVFCRVIKGVMASVLF